MSGHSKWSKVKHQKATTDVVKAGAFTRASRAISIAVREGGGITDPANNFRLRLAIDQARQVNMPKENIAHAIERGSGIGGNTVERVMYEAYGPGGVAMVIETATDNKKRTVSMIKSTLERYGGSLANPGSVMYLFDPCGVILIPKDTRTSDEMVDIAIDAGANDYSEKEDVFEIYTSLQKLPEAQKKLLKEGIAILHTQVIMRPTSILQVDAKKSSSVAVLVDILQELSDVETVYTNLE